MKYFEDSAIDQKVTFPVTYELTEANIVAFAEQWDPQPFHIDKAAAEKSYFGGLIACTGHLFGITGKLSLKVASPWAAVASLGITEMTNHGPGRPGDVLSLRSVCVSRRESKSKPDMGIVGFRTELVNQDDEVVLSFSSSMLVWKRAKDV